MESVEDTDSGLSMLAELVDRARRIEGVIVRLEALLDGVESSPMGKMMMAKVAKAEAKEEKASRKLKGVG